MYGNLILPLSLSLYSYYKGDSITALLSNIYSQERVVRGLDIMGFP